MSKDTSKRTQGDGRVAFSLTNEQAAVVLNLVRDAIRSDIPCDALRRPRRGGDLGLASLYASTVPDKAVEPTLLSAFICLAGQLDRG